MVRRPTARGRDHARARTRRSAYADGGPALAELCERARSARRAPRHVLAQGLHPAHDALPRRLPLLHVRAAAAAGRALLPDARGGAGDRRAGAAAGCHEALFTLGDKPELRYRAAREELDRARASHDRRLPRAMCAGSCCARPACCRTPIPGILDDGELLALRDVCASQGIMLETASERLSQRGGPHFGSPDKLPTVRLDAIDRAGRLRDPVHERHPDRHRRDAPRARRGAARAARPARAPRAPARDDRPELPRQGRHEDGGRARAVAGGPPLDDRRGAPPAAARDVPCRRRRTSRTRSSRAARRGHRRLGRRLARHARPRQPRGAVAGASRCWPRRRGRGTHARAAPLRSTRATCATPSAGSRRRARRRAARASDGDGLARDEGTGRRHQPEPPPAWQRGAARSSPARSSPHLARARRGERGARARRGRRRARCSARAGPRSSCSAAPPTRCAPSARRRRRHVRRLPEHQLHQRLLLPLRLLRVLQGQAGREPARRRPTC